MTSTLKFVDWDYRPAVFFDDPDEGAFAVLRRKGPWEKVDWWDVLHSGLMSEKEWRERFEPKFGPLDLSKLPVPGANKK